MLGVERGSKYQTDTHDLPPHATLLFYTDGVVEAESPDNSRLGIEGLARGLSDFAASAEDLIDTAVRTVTDFRRGLPLNDDMTLLAVAIEPVGAAQPHRPDKTVEQASNSSPREPNRPHAETDSAPLAFPV